MSSFLESAKSFVCVFVMYYYSVFLFFSGVFFSFMGYMRYFPMGLTGKCEQLLAAWYQPRVQKEKHRKDAIVCVEVRECVRMSSPWRPASVLFSDTN